MAEKMRVAVNGYGVIGKRVADAVRAQRDMSLVGVADIATDWRTRVLQPKGVALFAGTADARQALRAAGLPSAGGLEDLLGAVDVVVDCTPKHVAAENVPNYRERGLKFILEGGEKHTGHRPLLRRGSQLRDRGRARRNAGGVLQHHRDGGLCQLKCTGQ